VPETWKTVKAEEVRTGDAVRTKAGDVVRVSRIETSFFGRPEMLAFIEDTSERWYKYPIATGTDVEIRVSTGS
jgi:hypothetical protein